MKTVTWAWVVSAWLAVNAAPVLAHDPGWVAAAPPGAHPTAHALLLRRAAEARVAARLRYDSMPDRPVCCAPGPAADEPALLAWRIERLGARVAAGRAGPGADDR